MLNRWQPEEGKSEGCLEERQRQGFYRCRKGSQKRERRTTPSKADASDGELNWLVFHSELKVVSRELVTFIGWEY